MWKRKINLEQEEILTSENGYTIEELDDIFDSFLKLFESEEKVNQVLFNSNKKAKNLANEETSDTNIYYVLADDANVTVNENHIKGDISNPAKSFLIDFHNKLLRTKDDNLLLEIRKYKTKLQSYTSLRYNEYVNIEDYLIEFEKIASIALTKKEEITESYYNQLKESSKTIGAKILNPDLEGSANGPYRNPEAETAPGSFLGCMAGKGTTISRGMVAGALGGAAVGAGIGVFFGGPPGSVAGAVKGAFSGAVRGALFATFFAAMDCAGYAKRLQEENIPDGFLIDEDGYLILDDENIESIENNNIIIKQTSTL